MRRCLTAAAAAVLLASSCGGGQQRVRTEESAAAVPGGISDGHTAETSLDYIGTYRGRLRGAGDKEIEATLTLRPDGRFVLETLWPGRSTKPFREEGDYAVTGNLLRLRHEGAELPERKPLYCKVEENRLRLLDADRQPIAGASSDRYVLNKTKP